MEISKEKKAISREPRSLDLRNNDGRVADQRSPLTWAGISRFNLPQEMCNDPNFSYTFVAYSIADSEKRENFYEMVDKGYEVVRASEHPSLARQYTLTPFEKRDSDEMITRGGQILMKTTKENAKFWNDHYLNFANMQKEAAERHNMDNRNKPATFLNQSSRVAEGSFFR